MIGFSRLVDPVVRFCWRVTPIRYRHVLYRQHCYSHLNCHLSYHLYCCLSAPPTLIFHKILVRLSPLLASRSHKSLVYPALHISAQQDSITTCLLSSGFVWGVLTWPMYGSVDYAHERFIASCRLSKSKTEFLWYRGSIAYNPAKLRQNTWCVLACQ